MEQVTQTLSECVYAISSVPTQEHNCCAICCFPPRLRAKEEQDINRIRLSMSYIVFCSFQRNNGEHASKGPCRAGFSQSFYSVLISRDVLQGQGILKGKTFNWRVSSFMFCQEDLQCERKSSRSALRKGNMNMCGDGCSFSARPCCFQIIEVELMHLEKWYKIFKTE